MPEDSFLEKVSREYSSDVGIERQLIRYDIETILKYLRGTTVLEMGCANGVMTRELAKRKIDLHVVDGSKNYIRYVRDELGVKATFFHALFEEFEPRERYDAIIAASVLEHVGRPVELIRRIAGWASPEGQVHVVVPNALSLHRRLGVAMGLISEETELGGQDRAIGHHRVYTPETLDRDIESGGLAILKREGIFLKPLSNRQMENWPSGVLDGFLQVGYGLPDLCAHLYRLCTPVSIFPRQ